MEEIRELIRSLNKTSALVESISYDDTKGILQLITECLCTSDDNYSFKLDCFELACNIIKQGNITIEEKWTLYSAIHAIYFTDDSYDKYANELLLCYKYIFFEEKERIDEEVLQPLEENVDGPIILTITQFLGIKHAPTRRILDYAYTIKTQFNKEVIIINDCGTNCNLYEHIKMSIIPNYYINHCDSNLIEYKGIKIPFYQGREKMPNFREMEKILYTIRELKPSLVLNVGANSITSDMCSFFVKTATIPCSTRIPVSMAENLVVCRDIRDDDADRISRLEPWQNLITSYFNYIMPSKMELPVYTREQFDISESHWAISSAGNRMDDEITDDFLCAVDMMLDRIDNSIFILIGRFHQEERIKNVMKHNDRVIIPGSVEYASELIKLTNVYIQPRRKGGGRAAFEALYNGVPVFLLPYGDAWDVCGKEFEVIDYNDMVAQVVRLSNDKEYRQIMVQKSIERGKVLEDMPGMFKELFADLEIKI